MFEASDPGGFPGVVMTCGIDGVSFECSSPLGVEDLVDGVHAFSVTATDAAGNASAPAVHTCRVDTTPPTVNITAHPSDPTNDASAMFAFESTDPGGFSGVTTSCTLDGTAVPCTTSTAELSSLSDGTHTFAVTATDAAGNVSATASFAWRVDTTAPVSSFTTAELTVLVSAPPVLQDVVQGTTTDVGGVVAQASVTFTPLLGAATTTEATLDCASPSACTWTAPPPLLPGLYSVSVQATDSVGNTETPGPAPIAVVVV